ncbi:hypothetical protein [Nocardia transvalensis]|uniref:hypothetical protein n=1 Tax=Nocardia transvalensis TaxID=37333 RepID=UPI0018943403|nr:hypothetical protein [Nocardia transvalensis]MBF6330526.1 hypothetical protein [Nocardia transvalensis]
MGMVRAGLVPGRRALIYGSSGVLTIAIVCGAIVAAFGISRVVTGLFAGMVAGIALVVALFGRDVVMLTDEAIYRRTPLSETRVDWDRVVAGRFALDDHGRWSLALDLAGGDEPHGELVLLSIPPVVRPISNAYEHRKREQVIQIRKMLRHKQVPVTILPEIAQALHDYWKLAPSVR